jgi:hypothetical protein
VKISLIRESLMNADNVHQAFEPFLATGKIDISFRPSAKAVN